MSFAGYFFFLIRRVSRGNVVNSVIHGLFDFAIISGTVIVSDQGDYVGTAAILAYLVTGGLLIARRHHIEPADSAAAEGA